MENVLSSGYPVRLLKTEYYSERWCILSTRYTSNNVTFTKAHGVYLKLCVQFTPYNVSHKSKMVLLDTNYKLHPQHCKLSPFKLLSQHCLTRLTLIPEVPTTTVSTQFRIVFLKHETAQCTHRVCVVPFLCRLELSVKSNTYSNKYGLMTAALCSRNM
jgi:hypothetical protein